VSLKNFEKEKSGTASSGKIGMSPAYAKWGGLHYLGTGDGWENEPSPVF